MAVKKLCADRSIIAQFISQITADWSNIPDQVGGFEIRCLGENKTTVSQNFALGAVSQAIDLAVRMNANKLNVYMTINPIAPDETIKSGKSAKDRNVLRAHYSFADADDLQGINGLNEVSKLIEPDIIVTTGTIPHQRRHAYWRLIEPCYDLAIWTQRQKQLADRFNTDKAVVNPSRIMRVAGTISFPSSAKLAKSYIPELVTMHERST